MVSRVASQLKNLLKKLCNKIPGGIVLSEGSTIKITALEIYSQWNNGWKEIELFGLVDLDLLYQLVWKTG